MVKKADANQAAIVAALRGVGASVALTHPLGGGFPDLTVGFRGVNYLLEVKNLDGKGDRLTDDERRWHDEWRGRVHVVRTVDEALKRIGAIE